MAIYLFYGLIFLFDEVQTINQNLSCSCYFIGSALSLSMNTFVALILWYL